MNTPFRTFVLLFSLCAPLPLLALSSAKWQPFVEHYTNDLARQLKKQNIPGAALSIVAAGQPSVAVGFGKTKIKNGRQINAHTRFRLASVSKTFAGSLSAKLATQGQLSLGDPVRKYVTQATTHYKSTLKVKHLLSHSSGLVPNAYDNLIESRMKYEKIVPKLFTISPICKPSKCYGYQNVMFSVIGDVIKKRTGKSYQTWLQQAFFKPLKMRDASVGYKGMVADNNYAHPHVRGRKRWHTARLKKHYYKVAPAAGVNASASDMVQWLKAQLGLYPKVLSQGMLKKQFTPYTHTKKELRRRVWRKKLQQAHYGLGWRIYKYNNETIYYHSGWVQGYRTDIVIVPRLKVGFSLMLNAETGLINELTTQFLNKLLKQQKKA